LQAIDEYSGVKDSMRRYTAPSNNISCGRRVCRAHSVIGNTPAVRQIFQF